MSLPSTKIIALPLGVVRDSFLSSVLGLAIGLVLFYGAYGCYRGLRSHAVRRPRARRDSLLIAWYGCGVVILALAGLWSVVLAIALAISPSGSLW